MKAPPLSNPGLPAGKGKGANTSSGGADVSERGEIDWSGKKVKRRGDAYVSTPLPRGGGACGEGARTLPMPWPMDTRINQKAWARAVCVHGGRLLAAELAGNHVAHVSTHTYTRARVGSPTVYGVPKRACASAALLKRCVPIGRRLRASVASARAMIAKKVAHVRLVEREGAILLV